MINNPRMFFPGNNTSLGFFSFYQYIVPEDAKRKYVIKGGPGVGKSTLMRSLGEKLLASGLNVEFHWCSSDNESLDGICIPSCRIAVIDGTAPHIVDPRFPGAVDEIVELGRFWNRDHLIKNRGSVISLTREIGFNFEIACARLAEAAAAYREWQMYSVRASDPARIKRIARELGALLELEPGTKEDYIFKIRHLFCSAITPKGLVTHISTVLGNTCQIYFLKGSPGSGCDEVMKWLAKEAEILGHVMECYHCPLIPSELEAIYLPEIGLAFVNLARQISELPADLACASATEIDLDQHLNKQVIKSYEGEASLAAIRCSELIASAVESIARAKQLHDELELNYITAMDFAGVNAVLEELYTDIKSQLNGN